MKLTPHEVDELGERVAKSAAVVDAATQRVWLLGWDMGWD